MNRTFGLKRAVIALALVANWCALWQSVSFANVVSGSVIALLIVFSDIGTSAEGSFRVLPLAKFLWAVFVDLAKSTFSVALLILHRNGQTSEGIIRVQVNPDARDHLLLLSVAITLTPGTAVVDTDKDSCSLYLHLINVDQRAETEAHVHELAALSAAAFPREAKGIVA